MTQHLFIGVDGGATKCHVRIEDEAGRLLLHGTGGPANIRLSVDDAWHSINTVLNRMLQNLSIPSHDRGIRFHVGMGLAGCEVVEAYEAFIRRPHIFNSFTVTSDSHIACLGAHDGADGAIIIAGTGVVGFQSERQHTVKVGGWGFPQDDEGGGAWLGLQAVRHTFQWLDGRQPVSGLAKAIFAHFDEDLPRFVSWTNQANSTAFAELAPIVIAASKEGDKTALTLLHQAAECIDAIANALQSKQQAKTPLPCSLIGGITPFLQPFLSKSLQSRLRPCRATPDAGAIRLVRQHMATKKDSV